MHPKNRIHAEIYSLLPYLLDYHKRRLALAGGDDKIHPTKRQDFSRFSELVAAAGQPKWR
jgi:hypothetical protein